MSDLEELRKRAKRLGYRLLRRRDGYLLADADGCGPGGLGPEDVPSFLDAFEGIKPLELGRPGGQRFVIGQAQFEEREANKLKAKASLLHSPHNSIQ